MTAPTQKILFVTYGGGHAQMVLPVVLWFARHTAVEVQVLALTTAAPVFANIAGVAVLGFRDFVRPEDAAALAWGERLLSGNTSTQVSREESLAYLGLSYADLEHRLGTAEAAHAYARFGRQALRPVGVLSRIIAQLAPDVVVATSSPRAERAAIEAAGLMGLPSVCMVDLFAIDEIAWVGQPGYASRVCVLNQAVADRLLAHGRRPDEVCVTGNPSFDELKSANWVATGQALRAAQGWDGQQVVLWASQIEPAEHPSVPGRKGDTSLPGRIRLALEAWALAAPGRVLVLRPHPSEALLEASPHRQIINHGRDFELNTLLNAVNGVVTMNSTVGLQGHVAGKNVIQVLGSMFDDSAPLAQYGMAEACDDLAKLPSLLEAWNAPGEGRATSSAAFANSATEAVVRVILKLFKQT
ncbi:MAG: UDP-glycosyltransferase [Polaromonas sp.]|nr:UDP-glycosyltransferase [Polaromonas sp.]